MGHEFTINIRKPFHFKITHETLQIKNIFGILETDKSTRYEKNYFAHTFISNNT